MFTHSGEDWGVRIEAVVCVDHFAELTDGVDYRWDSAERTILMGNDLPPRLTEFSVSRDLNDDLLVTMTFNRPIRGEREVVFRIPDGDDQAVNAAARALLGLKPSL